ncbi:hypothetical protein MCEMIH16_02156 [Caulobacteraceae bacterium]
MRRLRPNGSGLSSNACASLTTMLRMVPLSQVGEV